MSQGEERAHEEADAISDAKVLLWRAVSDDGYRTRMMGDRWLDVASGSR
jgi:hypothetical protein